jgi:hypothetical protein
MNEFLNIIPRELSQIHKGIQIFEALQFQNGRRNKISAVEEEYMDW